MKVIFERVTAEGFAAAMPRVRLAALTFNAYSDLRDELGGDGPAVRYLMALATEHQKPVAVNMPGERKTCVIGPSGWTRERLAPDERLNSEWVVAEGEDQELAEAIRGLYGSPGSLRTRGSRRLPRLHGLSIGRKRGRWRCAHLRRPASRLGN